MSAHTPGPWVTVEVGEFASALAVSDENGVSLLTVVDEEGVKFGAVYNEADADLIAAAPELLEALKLCLAQLEPSMTAREFEAVEAARAAIAKATPEAKP